MMAHAVATAESKFAGNLSRYLQSLIEADMKGGTASGDGSRPRLDHARQVAPTITDCIEENVSEKYEKRLAALILESLPGYFDDCDDTRSLARYEAGPSPTDEELHSILSDAESACAPAVVCAGTLAQLQEEVGDFQALLVELHDKGRLAGITEAKFLPGTKMLIGWSPRPHHGRIKFGPRSARLAGSPNK